MKPPKRIFNSYQEAAEAQREQDVEDYYNEEEEIEDEEMEEADRLYDEMQDRLAGGN
jgi:hypothetical protein